MTQMSNKLNTNKTIQGFSPSQLAVRLQRARSYGMVCFEKCPRAGKSYLDEKAIFPEYLQM